MEIILGPVAVSENNVIGNRNDLPWGRGLKSDLKNFKAATQGHAVVMGRKTYESIGKPLPNRVNIILSRDPSYSIPDAFVTPNLQDAINKAHSLASSKVFLIGGENVYREGIPLANILALTRVHARIEGDVFLPAIDFTHWKLVEEKHYPQDADNIYSFTSQLYIRNT